MGLLLATGYAANEYGVGSDEKRTELINVSKEGDEVKNGRY